MMAAGFYFILLAFAPIAASAGIALEDELFQESIATCVPDIAVMMLQVHLDLEQTGNEHGSLKEVSFPSSSARLETYLLWDPKAQVTNRTATLERQRDTKTSSHMSHMKRAFATISCAVAAFAMLSLRAMGYQYQVKCEWLIFAIDLIVWYVLTAVNLASAQELLALSSNGISSVVISMINVFAGITVLPFGGFTSCKNISRQALLIIALCGSIYYFFALFVLEGLARGGIMLVSNARALEPFSTTAIMVLFAGESLSGLQYLSVLGAVVGVIVASPHAFGSAMTSNLLVVALLLFANVLNSLRNITLHQASTLGFKFDSKIALFALTSSVALPAGVLMLAFHLIIDHTPIRTNAMFPDLSLLAISSVSFVLYQVASFLVLMRVKPMMHAVLLAGKRVVTALLACALAGQTPTVIEIVGLCITTVAVFAFEAIPKLRPTTKAQREVEAEKKSEGGQADSENSSAKPSAQEQNLIKLMLLSCKSVGILLCIVVVACFSMAGLFACVKL